MVGPTDPVLVVTGIRGFLAGERLELHVGEAIVVGRSRSAELSLRRSTLLEERDDAAELMAAEPFLSVSRRHVRIHFVHADLVEVRDLSRNGTFVDGKRTTRAALTDLHERPHVVQLGSSERLRLDVHRPGDEPTELGEGAAR